MSTLAHILITGVGAPGVRGTIYAVRKYSLGVEIVGVDAKPDAVGRFFVNKFHQVPAPEDGSYVQTLAKICRDEGVHAIIPQTTREVSVLSRHQNQFSELGIQVMVSDEPAIEIANNKYRVCQTFEALGLPVPAYRLVRSEEELRGAAEQLGYPEKPVVIKPPVSNGMRGVRVLRPDAWDVERFLAEKPSGLEISLAELMAILRRGKSWPELLLTEYLPGPEYTVDVFVGSKMQVAIPRLRKAIRSGITFESVTELQEVMVRYSLLAAKKIGLRYAVGFQYKIDSEGTFKVLECNPRVQGTMVASSFTGTDVIGLSLRELLGEAPSKPAPPMGTASFYRFWGGVGVCGEQVYEI